MKKIDNFKTKYTFLSNFYYSPFMFNNKWYPTNEHFYQAHKTLDQEQHENIRTCKSPNQAKRLGNKIELRSDWEKVKIPIMRIGITLKFRMYDLREKLLNTRDIYLEEGNWWHDNFWGDCKCEKCKDKMGKNVLGKLLMEYRDFIKMDRWDKDQAFDVLDGIKIAGVYPTMLSAVDYIMDMFNIDRKEAKQILYEWIQKKKNYEKWNL